ncbi:PREDICTED: mediator-associated protein 2 isoform X1 [Nelumbo nucifera]|uniref:Mediator-associated protein 2 isoform X1 n=1 Tax=Nelumbo nucifera TaxID=4432 RepID=A0A1U7Z7U8_NELNU|nr:PREDICTED: mediator-associated protein 2 isoform X1 [Nelumbo nucifera]
MDATEQLYRPPPEFEENTRDPLVDISLTDSTEFWLIQWPHNQTPDFDGQEVTLKLHRDGRMGSFEGSSGKEYEVVSFASQEPDATVFLSSPSETQIVGKISRRVCLVHYPEPSELEKPYNHPNRMMYRSGGTSTANTFATPSQSTKQRASHYSSGISSIKERSSSRFESGEPSKRPKKRYNNEPTRSMDRTRNSEGTTGHSDVTSWESGHSKQGKSKKIKEEE